MKPEPSIFDEMTGDTVAEQEALARAEAEAAAGRGVPHSKVRAWLKTVGTPDETPMPGSWRK